MDCLEIPEEWVKRHYFRLQRKSENVEDPHQMQRIMTQTEWIPTSNLKPHLILSSHLRQLVHSGREGTNSSIFDTKL